MPELVGRDALSPRCPSAGLDAAPPSTPSGAQRYFPALDVLRVVAMSMVVLLHTPSLASVIWPLAPVWSGMNLGVDLFMLISGWLLGRQLIGDLERGDYSTARFYLKRWMRTLPPYLAMLGVLTALGIFSLARDGWTLAAHAAFLQVYLGVQRYGVSWSLCVEEHFYLVLPWIVPLLMKCRSARSALMWALATSCVQLGLRLIAFSPPESLPCITHLRSEGLVLGVLLAWTSRSAPATWDAIGGRPKTIAGIGLIGTYIVMLLHLTHPSIYFYALLPTLGTWFLALVFVAAVHERSPLARVALPGFRYLGELTYSIYLVHTLARPVLGAVAPELPPSKAVLLLCTASMALLLHHVVERPSLVAREAILRRWRRAKD